MLLAKPWRCVKMLYELENNSKESFGLLLRLPRIIIWHALSWAHCNIFGRCHECKAV